MKTTKKSFILYIDSLEILSELSDEEAGKLFKAIYDLQTLGTIPADKTTKLLLLSFKNQFARDNEKYDKQVERNKTNGRKGGRPKTQNNPVGLSGIQNNPHKADSDSDTDSDTDIDTEKDTITIIPAVSNTKKIKSEIPTLEDVKLYFAENGYGEKSAKKAFNYYNAANWKKKNGDDVDNWKQSVQQWFKDDDKVTVATKKLTPKEMEELF